MLQPRGRERGQVALPVDGGHGESAGEYAEDDSFERSHRRRRSAVIQRANHMRSMLLSASILFCLGLACGGSSKGAGSATLTGDGAFGPSAAVATTVSSSSFPNIGVYLTDLPVTCEQAKNEGKV